MEEYLMLIWVFSCVFAWGFTGSATPLGETIFPVGFRKLVRGFGYTTSVIAILTTALLAPKFTNAIINAGFGMATVSFLLWSIVHLAGAVYTVGAFSFRLANRTV